MVVQHNLLAMNSSRMLGITNKKQSKSSERLSSGYKINRAADDAAGLSISEKMRKQIRGLTQASCNAQDGISMVQTAEGALAEVHDMLQRMDELSIKAANGTNSSFDRSCIQSEIDQLVTEIDRVSTTTKFNETYLLRGTNIDGTPGKLTYDVAADPLPNINVSYTGMKFDASGNLTLPVDYMETGVLHEGYNPAAPDLFTVPVTYMSMQIGPDILFCFDGATKKALENAPLYGIDELIKLPAQHYGVAGMWSMEDLGKTVFTDRNDFANAIQAALDKASGSGNYKKAVFTGDNEVVISAFADLNSPLNVSLHVGADSADDNKITLSLDMMGARGLGINGLRVDGDTPDNATRSIDTIAGAIQKVSGLRSALGAVQNRLEHTVKNLDNVVENTTSAESQIRDTDMAKEMVSYSLQNILSQAGTSMLAQANQASQNILSLLG